MRVHESDYLVMRGSGIGSLFSNIFRGLIPIAKGLFNVGKKVVASPSGQRIMKAAKDSAIEAGIDLAHDALQGNNIKEATSKHISAAKRKVFDSMGDELRSKKTGGMRMSCYPNFPAPLIKIKKRKKNPKKGKAKRKRKKRILKCTKTRKNQSTRLKKKKKCKKKLKTSSITTANQVRKINNLLDMWV